MYMDALDSVNMWLRLIKLLIIKTKSLLFMSELRENMKKSIYLQYVFLFEDLSLNGWK